MHYEIQDLLDASILACTRSLLFTPDAKIYELVKGKTIRDSQFSPAAHFDQTSKDSEEERSDKHSRLVNRGDLLQDSLNYTWTFDPRISSRATAKFYPSQIDESNITNRGVATYNDIKHTNEAVLQLISVDTADAQLSFIERMLQSKRPLVLQTKAANSAEDYSLKWHAEQYKLRENLHLIEKRLGRSSSNESDATSLIGLRSLDSEQSSINAMPVLCLQSCEGIMGSKNRDKPSLSITNTHLQDNGQIGVHIHESGDPGDPKEPVVHIDSPKPPFAQVACTDDEHYAMGLQANSYDEDQAWGKRPQKTLDWSETVPQGTMKEDLRARNCSVVSTATWSTRDEIRIRRDQAAWAAGELAMDSIAERVSKWLGEVDSTVISCRNTMEHT